MRDHSRPQVAPVVTGDPGPGLMVFDAAGELMSINDDASAWLDEVAGDLAGDDGFGVRLPLVVVSTLIRARAIAEERAHGSARARMRSSATGRWLVCHASCLRDAEGRIGSTALAIEPAKASEVAPIITEAYDLSPRERQITQLIARGAGTADIAAGLHLSAHTVRDYVGDLREGGCLEPGRAGGDAVRRALRPDPLRTRRARRRATCDIFVTR